MYELMTNYANSFVKTSGNLYNQCWQKMIPIKEKAQHATVETYKNACLAGGKVPDYFNRAVSVAAQGISEYKKVLENSVNRKNLESNVHRIYGQTKCVLVNMKDQINKNLWQK